MDVLNEVPGEHGVLGSAVPKAAISARVAVVARIAFAAIAGSAWGHGAAATVVPLVFAAFWQSRTKREAWCVIAAYYVAAGAPLFVGAADYLGMSSWGAWGAVGCTAALLAAVWAVCHPGDSPCSCAAQLLRTALLLFGTLLPPAASVSVAHPFAVAGLWFPGLGLVGLLLTYLLVAAMRSIRWGVVPGACVALLAVVRPNTSVATTVQGDLDAARTIHAPRQVAVTDYVQHWYQAQDAMRIVRLRQTASIVVLPESSVGLWSEAMEERWGATSALLRERGQTVLIGTTFGGTQEPLWAGVIALGATRAIYRQRVPIPLVMWRPGSAAFEPSWFGPGTIQVGRYRLGVLVCWEIGVTWAVVRSVLEGSDALVGVANVAWVPEAVRAAQAQQLVWWGRLFRLPVALAVNG